MMNIHSGQNSQNSILIQWSLKILFLVLLAFISMSCSKVAFDSSLTDSAAKLDTTTPDAGFDDIDDKDPSNRGDDDRRNDDDSGDDIGRHDDDDNHPDTDEDDDGEGDEHWLRGNCFHSRIGQIAPISDDATDVNIEGSRGFKVIREALRLSVEDFFGLLIVRAAQQSNIKRFRGGLILNSLEIGEIAASRGPLCLSSRRAHRIEKHRGPIWFRGLEDGQSQAQIELIKDHFGPLILRNVRVQKIENTLGRIYLINSTIEETKDVRGPVFVDGKRVN